MRQSTTFCNPGKEAQAGGPVGPTAVGQLPFAGGGTTVAQEAGTLFVLQASVVTGGPFNGIGVGGPHVPLGRASNQLPGQRISDGVLPAGKVMPYAVSTLYTASKQLSNTRKYPDPYSASAACTAAQA